MTEPVDTTQDESNSDAGYDQPVPESKLGDLGRGLGFVTTRVKWHSPGSESTTRQFRANVPPVEFGARAFVASPGDAMQFQAEFRPEWLRSAAMLRGHHRGLVSSIIIAYVRSLLGY
jgi:hypothetical protein